MSPPPSVDESVHTADQAVPLRGRAFGHPAEPAVRAASVWPVAKRVFDVVFAAALLLATVPVLVLIAIAIKLDSPGPVFHRVRRVGYRGRPLSMLKFRKMHHQAQGAPLTAVADPRLTSVGAFLTRSRLDELPQLWDVLWGRMSIVGPRPEDPLFVALHPEHYRVIHSVRPGITGITQLAFAEERRILDAVDPIADYVTRILPHKVHLDLLYAEQSRMKLDVAVLRWTFAAVLMHRPVAVHRVTGRMTTRRRPSAPDLETVGADAVPVSRSRLPRALLRRAELRMACPWRPRLGGRGRVKD